MQETQDRSKQFVKVRADHEWNGDIRPLKVRTHEGLVLTIDKILDVRRACSPKVGGQGVRYSCRAGEDVFYLFHDRDQWFIEL